MSYLYLKNNQSASKIDRLKSSIPKRKFLAYFLFISGVFLFGSAIVPILRFQFEYSFRFNQMKNPLSNRFYNQSGNILGDITTDYTQLSNWFVSDTLSDSPSSHISNSEVSHYTLSIPSLKIIDAVVEVGGSDLKKSLIQYPQTALPGQLGNTVVFGHSVLPQFFNPKSYLTIFSTLYRLKPGDEIFINYDSVKYKYVVEEMFEVQPTNLSVLEQRFDGRYMTVITCSPPGTYLRRLIVKTRIVDY